MVAPSSTATGKSCDVPMESRGDRVPGERAQGGEVGAAGLGVGAAGGMHIRPATRTGRAPGSLRGRRRDAGLGLLPRDVDLDQDLGSPPGLALQLAERRLGRDGVDELDEGGSGAPCGDCSWPMKCQRRPASGQAPTFSRSCCARFSPSSVTPASASPRRASTSTYLTAVSSSTAAGSRLARAAARAIWLRTRAAFSASRPRSRPPHYSACRPVRPPSRRWEKTGRGRAPCTSMSCIAATPARRAGAATQPDPGWACRAPRAGEARPHLVADLVAAAAEPGPIAAWTGPLAASSRRPSTPSGTIPPASPRQPPCSAATAPSAASRSGRQSATKTERRSVRERRGLTVLVGRRTRGPWRLGGAPHGRAVDLPAVEEALARVTDRRGEPLAVRVDVRAVVLGEPPEVERGERAAGDPPAAGGEQQLRTGKRGGDVLSLPAEGRRQRDHGPDAPTSGPRPGTGEDCTIEVVVCP